MSITHRAAISSKLFRFLNQQNLHFHASFLHSVSENPSNAEADPSYSSSPLIPQIVEILKSNDNASWKTNQHLSYLLFSDTHSFSSDHIHKITLDLGDPSTALNFVQFLRSNSPAPDSNLLSFAFHAVFELGLRKAIWKDELLDLVNKSKQLGVPLTVDSAVLLIQFFGKAKMIEKSMWVYDELDPQTRNTSVRNVLISELLRSRRLDDALKVLDEMLQPNAEFPPNVDTFGVVFSVLVEARKRWRVVSEEDILELAVKFGKRHVLPNSVMFTRCISELCRSKRTDLAWKLLHAFMDVDGAVGVVPCNAMLTGLAKERQFAKMEVLMGEMLAKGISPTVVTLGICINHLCKSLKIDEALNLFEKMKRGEIEGPIEPDVVIYNTLIDGLCKVERTEEGLAMMRKMVLEGKCSPTSVTYNCLVDGFCKVGELGISLELFDEMEKQGVLPNIITVNTLVSGMCRHGKAGSALKFYREMERKGLKGNKVTYTTLVSAFFGVNNINKAMEMFEEMRETCAPDAIVYYTLISGFSQAGLMDDVELFFEEMKIAGFRPDIACYNVMINGFCKRHKLDKAYWLLKEMEKVRIRPDIITYNTLISHCSKTGDLKTAHELLRKMVDDNVVPTVVTYGALIHGCCLVGELDEAMKIFRQMSSSTRVPPNTVVYNVLIDALCQKNEMREALSLYEDMIAKGVIPEANTFNALFKGLRDEYELEKALELMGKMTEMACHPDYITLEVLSEWLSREGKADKLKQFVEGFR